MQLSLAQIDYSPFYELNCYYFGLDLVISWAGNIRPSTLFWMNNKKLWICECYNVMELRDDYLLDTDMCF